MAPRVAMRDGDMKYDPDNFQFDPSFKPPEGQLVGVDTEFVNCDYNLEIAPDTWRHFLYQVTRQLKVGWDSGGNDGVHKTFGIESDNIVRTIIREAVIGEIWETLPDPEEMLTDKKFIFKVIERKK